MNRFAFPLMLCVGLFTAQVMDAQDDYYFPPNTGSEWETIDFEELGWCSDPVDELLELLESSNTKAFILLYKGKIVMENYFGNFTQDSLWVWNSAGKAITAFAVGKAQEQGLIDIHASSSTYLGEGWTSLSPEQEILITPWHQLTMTTGIDDSFDPYCTDPECLQYLADAGTRWAYHNGPYTNLTYAIEEVSGVGINNYVLSQFGLSIGMTGFYFPFDYNRVFISRARDMARFGLMVLANGTWNGTPVLNDQDYLSQMLSPSQDLNESYGYLWWLNEGESYMVPSLQNTFPGPFLSEAPLDMKAAIGKDAQLLNLVPSGDLVLVRMGSDPELSPVPFTFNNDLWAVLNDIICTDTQVAERTAEDLLKVWPVPASDVLHISGLAKGALVELYTLSGERVLQSREAEFTVAHLPSGMYVLRSGPHSRLVVCQ